LGLFDFFKPVSSWTVEEVRTVLRERSAGSCNLVDVRQPGEYESGHLPGARLIPIAELGDRLGELDRSKPTITYCRSGVRSRAAAATLSEAGFSQVHSMAGGMNAWNGLVAGGAYETGLAYFPHAARAEEMISLSFALEEGNRVFYDRISRDVKEEEAASIFRLLGQAEERHKETLRELHARVSGKGGDPEHPEEMEAGRFLEGGAPLEETLVWVQGKTVEEILELAIAMEANSLDRYIKMGRAVADERSREVFLALSREEQKHLERMTSLLDRLKP